MARTKIDETSFQRYLEANPDKTGLAMALSLSEDVHPSSIVKVAVIEWWNKRASTEPPTREEVYAFVHETFK